jgi:hypothetical protein
VRLAAAPVAAWPGGGKRWALVIGIDRYLDGQISPLRGAANDAARLADALSRYAGFPADQVVVLASDQPEERQPTRVNILRRLSNLASVVPKDGLLLVAFAGHGVERRGRAYLLPSDAQLSDDIELLEDTAVSVSRVRERIRATGVAQVVVLLDACRNDPGGRADAPNPLTQAFVGGFDFGARNGGVVAFATLFATAEGQRAYESAEKRQGYFTWAVVEGLKGGAADERGEVTLGGLIRYVQETVPRLVSAELGAVGAQRPFARVEGYRPNELVIAAPRGPRAASGVAKPDPLAAELEFWGRIKDSAKVEDFRAYLGKYPDGVFADLARRRAEPRPPPADPNEITVEVPGDSAGADTGVVLRAGEFVTIVASGSVTVGRKDGAVTPDGGKANFMSDRPVGAIGVGGLIGYVELPDGKKTRKFAVGALYKFTAETAGRLFLAVNDRNLKDNSGGFTVRIRRSPR